MKTFRIIAALLQAIILIFFFGIFCLIAYSEFIYPYNIIITASIFILGLYVAKQLFNFIRRRGIIATMSGNNATYDLDELEPTSGCGVTRLSPEEIPKLFFKNNFNFINGVTISIWGDWNGRMLDAKHQFDSINFNSTNNILTIKFTDNYILKIKKPSMIFHSNSYLKIVKAKEILWQTPTDTNLNNHQFSYLNTGQEIKTKSNTKWKPQGYGIGIGMNALYLQG